MYCSFLLCVCASPEFDPRYEPAQGWALSGLHGDVVAINQSILSSLYQLTLAVWDPGSTLNTESSKTMI